MDIEIDEEKVDEAVLAVARIRWKRWDSPAQRDCCDRDSLCVRAVFQFVRECMCNRNL
jgi:hypothetical protein